MSPPSDDGKKRSRGPLNRYLTSIRRYGLLTPSGEIRVGQASQEGHEGARKTLVEGNLRLVVRIAMEYRDTGVPVEDLVAEGNLGLLEAAKRFDPSRGVRFASYASWWIRKFMIDAATRQRRMTTAPTARGASGEMAPSTPSEAPRRRQRILSLEDSASPSGEHTVGDAVADEAEDPEEIVLESQFAEALRSILFRLPAQERLILTEHYGLGGEPPKTLQRIGETLGLTRERVRQIELRALAKARNLLRGAPRRGGS